MAGEYTLSKSSVNVKAPTSVLDRISKVVAECELDGASADFSKKCKLVLYDKHGRTIKNNNITLSTKKVLVSVEVSKEERGSCRSCKCRNSCNRISGRKS